MSIHASPLKARRRTDVLFALGVCAAVGVLMWIVLTMQSLTHDLRTSNDARDALARQVQQLGGKPVAGPPGSRGDPGPSVTGSQGPQGDPGQAGPTGPPGPTGSTGSAGQPGASGASATGAPGAAGVPGPAGPQGDPGPAGAPGADGKDGVDGTDGRDGQTCPDGYSLQAPAADPDALVCRRDGAPQPTAPGGGLLGAGLLASTAMYRRL